jgi:hypothetical protein
MIKNNLIFKVLGDITPFSWPTFARAQDEYAKKNPEKCRADAGMAFSLINFSFHYTFLPLVPTKSVASSIIPSSNINSTPLVPQQTNTSTLSKLPLFPFTPARASETIWKCPTCTKEHPAQTETCSVCRGINLNYKKLSGKKKMFNRNDHCILLFVI